MDRQCTFIRCSVKEIIIIIIIFALVSTKPQAEILMMLCWSYKKLVQQAVYVSDGMVSSVICLWLIVVLDREAFYLRYFFNLYVDDLIIALQASDFGCTAFVASRCR